MNRKMTLNLDSLTVTSFETDSNESVQPAAAASVNTVGACCGTGCNTRLTCSTNLC